MQKKTKVFFELNHHRWERNLPLTLSPPKSRQQNFCLQIFEKCKSKLYHIENSKTRGQTVDLDEVAHHEPPHQDLRCLQIQLNSSLVVKELNALLILRVLESLSIS